MHPTVSGSAAAASSIAMRLLEVVIALNTASEAVERAAALRVRSEDRDRTKDRARSRQLGLVPFPTAAVRM
jgi:hypothetical protein